MAAAIFLKILIACLLGPGRPLPSMLPFARHQRGRLKPSRPCRVDETAPPSIYMEAGRVEKARGLAYVNGYFRALAYGQSLEAAVSKVQALALRVLVNAWSRRSWPSASEYFLRSGMSAWPSTRARRVLAALLRIGRVVKRQSGSQCCGQALREVLLSP